MSGESMAYPGILHQYAPRLTAFEFRPETATAGSDPTNTLLFVGGLFDDLLTVHFTPLLVSRLPPTWNLTQLRLSSSSSGFGIASLDQDAKELAQCVSYVRALRPEGKVVLMGHSSGAGAVVRYASVSADRAKVDGYVLQAPASDREGMTLFEDEDDIASTVSLAKSYVARGDGEDILPKKASGMLFPISARRYLSLASPAHDGDDDIFSSDLSDDRIKSLFGALGATGVPVQILAMEDDQFVPPEVDKEAVLGKWKEAIEAAGGKLHGESGIVEEHDHNGEHSEEDVQVGMVMRIAAFVKDVVGR